MAKYFVAVLLGLAGLAGCRMCACPYDDCYPVIESNYGPPESMPADDGDYVASGDSANRATNQPHVASPRLAPAAR